MGEAEGRDAEALARIRELVGETPIRLVRTRGGLVDLEAPREWRVRNGAAYAAVCNWIWDPALGGEAVRRCLVKHLPEST